MKSGILDAPKDGEIKDTEAMVTADGEVIEVKKDSTKNNNDVKEELLDSVKDALEVKNKKTEKKVIDGKVKEVVVDDAMETKKVVSADNEVVEV